MIAILGFLNLNAKCGFFSITNINIIHGWFTEDLQVLVFPVPGPTDNRTVWSHHNLCSYPHDDQRCSIWLTHTSLMMTQVLDMLLQQLTWTLIEMLPFSHQSNYNISSHITAASAGAVSSLPRETKILYFLDLLLPFLPWQHDHNYHHLILKLQSQPLWWRCHSSSQSQ